MPDHNSDAGRRATSVAVLACLLVVGSALAVAPGTASAEHIDGEITYDGADGELVVTVFNASEGNFTGGEESIQVEIGGETVRRSSGSDDSRPGENYTYTVGPGQLADIGTTNDDSRTEVVVFHDGQKSFTETVQIRYLNLGTPEFTDSGQLRLQVQTSFGVGSEDSVSVQVETSGSEATREATYTNTSGSAPALTLERDALAGLGALRSLQPTNVTDDASDKTYLNGRVQVTIRDQAGSPEVNRVSGSGVRFASVLFEDGRTYVVNASSGEGQYVRTLQASGQSITLNSSAIAAEQEVTLTVVDEATGNRIVDGESVSLPMETRDAFWNETTGTVEFNESLPDRATDANATVWVKSEGGSVTQYEARLDATNGTLSGFSKSPSWPDAENASLLISDAGGSTIHATVSLQSGGSSGGGNTDGSTNSGLFAAFGVDRNLVLFAVAVVVGIGVVAGSVFAFLSMRDSSSVGSSKRTATGESPGTATVDVTFEVFDEVAGTPYPDADRVVAQRRGQTDTRGTQGDGFGATSNAGRDRSRSQGINVGTGSGQSRSQGATAGSKRIDVVASEGEAELEGGRWVFEVRQDGRTIGTRSHRIDPQYDSDRVVVSVDPYTVDVSVTDGPEREPLDGATVEANVDVGRWSGRKPTDASGTVTFEVPRSASEAKFTAQHQGQSPVESTHRVERAAQNGVDLAIGAETGSMEIETVVGGRSLPNIDVRITPVGDEPKEYADEDTITTNSEGRRRIEGAPAGEYELSADPTLPNIGTTAAVESVHVTDGGTAEVMLSIGVSYSATADQRDRLSDLRDRIEELTAATNRDVAIPRYYGTVLASALGVIDEVESTPERAVEEGIPPDETVTAILDAVEAGIRAVDGAMSERRNVKLFGDCASMPPAEVEWDGEATLDAFLNRVAEGGDHERRMLRDRLRETDEVLDRKWGEVNEIAPARKLHDRLGELARETGGIDDELAVIAQTYVAICLLDAVGGIFDHDALVGRLNSGSY